MNAARQSTAATTRTNCDQLASTLALMEHRAGNGHHRKCAQRAMQFLTMFTQIVFKDQDSGELKDDQIDLADVTRQWTNINMLGLQGALTDLKDLSLDTEQDRILARLAFKPFFAKKNHCDDWFKYTPEHNYPRHQGNGGNRKSNPFRTNRDRQNAGTQHRQDEEKSKGGKEKGGRPNKKDTASG